MERTFKFIKNKINESNFSQKIRYRFLEHETVDQLELVDVFDLETQNNQEFVEAYGAGLYDNRLRDRWDRDSSCNEKVTEKDNDIVFDGSIGNSVENMPNYISENHEGD